MADDRAAQIARIQQIERIHALEAGHSSPDPAQPGVAAIGSAASPAKAQQMDWVDRIKNAYSGLHSQMQDEAVKYNKENFGSETNPLQDIYSKAASVLSPIGKAVSYPLQWGDRANDLGAPGLEKGIPIPFTNDKKITIKDLANLTGNTLGAELGGRALGAAGEWGYDSAFKNIDKKLIARGKTPISQILREEGGAPVVTTKMIEPKIKEIGDQAMADRAAGYQKVNDKGIKIDPDYPHPEAEAVLTRMRRNPNLRAQADTLQEHLDNFRKEGKVDIDRMSEWKSDNANSLPEKAYDPNGKPLPWAQKYLKALASDQRQAIVDAGEAAEPGLGEKIEKANDIAGSVIESKKPVRAQIDRATTQNVITPVKTALAAINPLAALAAYGGELSKLTLARTALGKAGMAAPSLTPLVQANALSQNLNPWSQK